MTYIQYHIWRFREYWKREGRQLHKDIASSRLAVNLSLALSLLLAVSYVMTGLPQHAWSSSLFLCFGLSMHVYRDYRKGYHTGWARKQLKEAACQQDR